MKKVKFLAPIMVALSAMTAKLVSLKQKTNKKDCVVITTVEISEIISQFQEDGIFYITVKFDHAYTNSDEVVSFKVSESIYNQISKQQGFIGMTLRMIVPHGQPKLNIIDSEMIFEYLKTYSYNCEVIYINTVDNEILQ
ncbi:MAG: hypothetical protein ATN33_08890 [Epulopiscium sp. Nele67-Bin001]|nr:MAG: hypothetical protein ATN33_08890 [Epulopiscium sp. Nele67-Bin001]